MYDPCVYSSQVIVRDVFYHVSSACCILYIQVLAPVELMALMGKKLMALFVCRDGWAIHK